MEVELFHFGENLMSLEVGPMEDLEGEVEV